MAYALRPQSARRAQVQKKCELCETDINIQYRCVECQKYICEKCNTIHRNEQTSAKHEIISIRSNKDIPSYIVDNIPCDKHKKKEFIKYCYDCTLLVCEDCIDKTHREHQLQEIHEGCDCVILMTQDVISKDLWFCENRSKQLKTSTQMYHSSYDNARKKIDIREKEMKDAIEIYANQLRAQIETKKVDVEKQRETSEKKIEEISNILIDKESELKKAKKSRRADKIIIAIREIINNLPDLDFHPLLQEVSDFVSEDITVSEYFGSLQSKPKPNEQTNIDFQVIKSYTTELNVVERILTLDTKTAWISYDEMHTLSKINIDDNIRIVKNVAVKVRTMTLTANKDILLSFSHSYDVSLLKTKTAEIKHFLSMSPLCPCVIHVNMHNEIILGVIDGNSYNPTDTSCRKVVLFGTDGKLKQSYEYDKHKQRLFTIPYRITSNVNNDILIIDNKSRYHGRVVVLNREGQFKWVYQGHLSVNSGINLFCPADVVTTSIGHVIISDLDTHALHVLSEHGDVLTCKVMEDQGMTNTRSLDIDTEGQLWVGCDSEDDLFDAKIHIVTFSS